MRRLYSIYNTVSYKNNTMTHESETDCPRVSEPLGSECLQSEPLTAEMAACHECDLLLTLPELPAGAKAVCPRCGHVLAKHIPHAQQKLMALSVAALVLLLLANLFPFLGFEVQGQTQHITLLQSVLELWQQDYAVLAAMVLVFILLAPLLFLVSLLYVLLPLSVANKKALGSELVCKGMFWLTEWSMTEVFLIGVLVSLIKIMALASVILGLSFWAYIAFCVVMTALLARADNHQFWHWLAQAEVQPEMNSMKGGTYE